MTCFVQCTPDIRDTLGRREVSLISDCPLYQKVHLWLVVSGAMSHKLTLISEVSALILGMFKLEQRKMILSPLKVRRRVYKDNKKYYALVIVARFN